MEQDETDSDDSSIVCSETGSESSSSADYSELHLDEERVHHMLDYDLNYTNAIVFPKFESLTKRKAVELVNTLKGFHRIVVSIPLGIISARLRELWCLTSGSHMIINLEPIYPSTYFRAECPSVNVSLCNAPTTECEATKAVELAMQQFFNTQWNRPLRENLMGRTVQFAVDRLTQLSNFCVQCGTRHLGAHPLLSVCANALCVFQRNDYSSTLGPRLWADSAELIAFLFNKAWHSDRKQFVCLPYPVQKDGMFSTEQAVDEVCAKLSEWCPRCVFSTWKSWERFKDSRETASSASFLYWLSDHMRMTVRLPPGYRIASLCTDQQYLLPPVPSRRERLFEAAKAHAGGKTRFLFHGSPVENWYRIMSDGLLVLSGTSNQLYGSAYGTGIYMSENPAESAKYSYSSRRNPPPAETQDYFKCDNRSHPRKSHINDGTWCLALCEVVDDPSKFASYGTPHFVLVDPACVQVRMLFIYPSTMQVPALIIPQEENYNSVRNAMEFYRNGPYFERLLAVFDSDKDPDPSTADHSFIPPFPAPYC